MRALIIGDTEVAAINEAVATARKRPNRWEDIGPNAVPIDVKLSLADRKGQRIFPGISVLLAIGYRAAISFEYQPSGLHRHLSVSVDEPGKVPHQAAIAMIAKAFGFHEPPWDGAWLEEFEPGHYALNILQAEGEGR